ncbi:OmpA family protein [Actinomyces radicidentis]|uniref:OmpA family protein n=1 Tax=Actinomyces radicidentis TaxID=111015 RepID=UPI0026E0FDE7|nr:OmpA family protein [Actinomyces radicidentis]
MESILSRKITRVHRRTFLLLPTASALTAMLASCSSSDTEGKGNASSSSPATRQGAASPSGASTPSSTQLHLTDVLDGHTLDVAAGPLIRIDKSTSLLPLHVERPADDPAAEESIDLAGLWIGGSTTDQYGTRPLRLIDPAGMRLWVTTVSGDPEPAFVEPGGSADLTATFGGVPQDLDTVVLTLAQSAFVMVSVVDRDQAAQLLPELDIDAALSAASPDPSRADPIALERYTESAAGTVSALTTDTDVTVVVSGDVTFDSDSAELSAQADGILATVVDGVTASPGGGELTITGHTDDVADEAYNQTLSEKRAQAVADRLASLMDLSAWTVSVAGKGETEPVVEGTTPQARAANRRVEIVVSPKTGTSGKDVMAADGGEVPAADGATETGADGVVLHDASGTQTVAFTLDTVTRVGGVLLGELRYSYTSGALGVYLTDQSGFGRSARGEQAGLSTVAAASGVTLLVGETRVFPLDYVSTVAKAHLPVADLNLSNVGREGRAGTCLVAWPDVETGAVTVDFPHQGDQGPDDSWRLTDVPVTGV